MTFCIVCMYACRWSDELFWGPCTCMYVCSCSMNQCSIVHSSTSWQRCETQVHFNDVVAPPAAEHGSGTDSCMYVCMYVCVYLICGGVWLECDFRSTHTWPTSWQRCETHVHLNDLVAISLAIEAMPRLRGSPNSMDFSAQTWPIVTATHSTTSWQRCETHVH